MFESNVLDQIPEDYKFDTIFWNYPFHTSDKTNDEKLTELDISLRDPGYVHLDKVMRDAKARLEPHGKLLLGFSETTGNSAEMWARAEKWGWDIKIAERKEAGVNPYSVCILELRPRQQA